jgi:hypothetical protein
VHLKDLQPYGLRRIDMAGAAVLIVASLAGYLTAVAPFLQQRAITARLRSEMQAQREKASQLKTAIAAVKERLQAIQLEMDRLSPARFDGAHQPAHRRADEVSFRV